jgi:hypothetical protein
VVEVNVDHSPTSERGSDLTGERRLHRFIDKRIGVVVEGSRRQRSCRSNGVDHPTAAPSNSAGLLPYGRNAIYHFS